MLNTTARRPALALGAVPTASAPTPTVAIGPWRSGGRDRPEEPLLNVLARAIADGRILVVVGDIQVRETLDATVAFPSTCPTPPGDRPHRDRASLEREGDFWTFTYDDRIVRVRDGKGINFLARMLESPGIELHALELARAREHRARVRAGTELDLAASSDGGTGPILDAQAKRQYRARLNELREDLEQAESFNDPERSARAREEIDFLARELARAVGLGGRDRQTGSNAERARVSVTRSIRALLRRISEYDPALGHELQTSVRTGTFCSYSPDPARPRIWEVRAQSRVSPAVARST